MLSALFVTILISLASGTALDISGAVEKLLVRVHNDDVKIEINHSPLPTIAGLFTTATPTPSPSPSPTGTSPAHVENPANAGTGAASGTGCDFEYHKTTNNGEPIDIDYNCNEETTNGGTVSSSVNIKSNGRANVDISVKNN